MGNETTGSHRSRSKKTAGVTLAIAALAGAFTIASASGTASGDGWEATAVLRDVSGNKVGKVKFEGDEHGTLVKATLNGVTVGLDGYHGFHVHANDTGAPVRPGGGSGSLHECRWTLEQARRAAGASSHPRQSLR